MFCPKCGAQNPDGSPFCASCGAPLSQQAPMNQGMNYNQSANNNQFDPKGMVDDFTGNIKNFGGLGIPSFIMLGGAVLLLISLFMPYITVKAYFISVSASMMKAGAFHWLLAIVIALGSAFVAVTKRPLPMLVCGCVAIGYFIMEAIWQHESFASFAIGFYFMLIACAAILGGGIYAFIKAKK